ncbi:Uncharacterised protein [uncultured archaeon]|nr:Uncharacterised protein [uncultured archaeon]
MFTEKEAVWILISIIIFEFIVLFPIPENFNVLLILVPIIIIFVNVISKKIASEFFNIKIEHKSWEVQRFGWYHRSKLKKPFPFGLVFPVIIAILSLGTIKPLTLMQFDYENMPEKRMLKERGLKRKSEINDSDIGFTAFWGFASLLVLSLIAALLKFPELATYSIFYGAWNLVPYGNLDGSKLFFGSIMSWITTVILYLIALALIVILYLS